MDKIENQCCTNAHDLELHRAVFESNFEAVVNLLKSGTDSNTKDIHGNTPLHLAAMLGNKGLITYQLIMLYLILPKFRNRKAIAQLWCTSKR
jgi:ankyrin repeat protein